GQTILAVTAGSSSMSTVSMPVETLRPVAGQLIMMMPMTLLGLRAFKPTPACRACDARRQLRRSPRHGRPAENEALHGPGSCCSRVPHLPAGSMQARPFEKAVAVAGGDADLEGAAVAIDRQRHFDAGLAERPHRAEKAGE